MRLRPVAAGALLASLAAGWFVVSRHASADAPASGVHAAVDAAAGRPHAPADARPRTGTRELRARLTPGLTCTDAAAAPPRIACSVDHVDVQITLLGPAAGAAYRRLLVATSRPGSGAPACARGGPDERSWSRPNAPARPVGRYRCTIEHGRAAMWWTDDGLLAHAVAPDGDLARLFAWWREFDT